MTETARARSEEHTLPWLPVPGFIHRLGITQRIQVGFAIGAAVVVIVSLVAALMVRLMSDTLSSMVDEVRLEQGTAAAMKDAVADENQGVQGYLITGGAGFLDTFDSAHQRFLDRANQLKGPKASATDRATAAEVIGLEADFHSLAQQEIDLSQQGFPNAAAFHWQTEGQQAEQRLHTRLDDFLAERDRALGDKLADARHKEEITRAIFAPLVMLVAGFALFSTLVASRSIKRRFESLSDSIARIEQGDFHVEAGEARGDELGRLATSIRDMARALDRESHERDRLFAEGARKNEEMSALYDMARTVNQSLDTGEVLRLALSKLIAHTGTDAGLALLRDGEDGRFTLAVVDGLSEEQVAYATGLWDEDQAQEVAEQAMRADGITRMRVADLGATDTRYDSAIAVPLGARGEGRGLLFLIAQHQVTLDDDQQRLVEGLQKQVGIALEHAWLYEQSRRLAVAEERNRLARELHDSVTQSLFSMSMMAQALPSLIERNPSRANERSLRLSELARGALAEMRMLILELRPAALQELGLVSALERYVAGFGSREGLECSFGVDGLQRRLPQAQEEALFRVAQEALSNVARHAQAQHVNVSLDFEPDCVRLSVEDDGVGLPPQGASVGFGMTSMRERAEQLGGSFEVESRPEQGTTIHACVPAPAASTSIAG